MKILAFAASSSLESINKKFVTYVAEKFKQNNEIEILDLNDYELPIYSIDLEKNIGIPENVKVFQNKLAHSDLIIISLAEHNGTYTSVFKNLFDWLSRNQLKCFEGKKMVLLSTSPGPRGGLGVMEAAKTRFPIHGANIISTFSLPNFVQNFDINLGIINPELNQKFEEAILIDI